MNITNEATIAKFSDPKPSTQIIISFEIKGWKGNEINNIKGTTSAKFSNPKPQMKLIIFISNRIDNIEGATIAKFSNPKP